MLRDYQSAGIEEILQALNQFNKVLYQLPTGGGKTVIASSIVDHYLRQNKTVWFVVHRKNLIRQTSLRFIKEKKVHTFIASGRPFNSWRKLVLVMIQTYSSKAKKVPLPDLVVVDESHHALAQTYNCLQNTKMLGLTATPWTMSKNGLHEVFDHIILGPKVSDLIENKYLAKFEIKSPPIKFNRSSLHISKGEFVAAEIEEQMNRPVIYGDIVFNYQKYLGGQQVIGFTPNIEFSKEVELKFLESGIKAAHIDSKMDSSDVTAILEKFEKGEVDVLLNVNMITEGYDLPSCAGVLLMSPTKSLIKHLQQIGRGLRVDPMNPDKKAIILDFVYNCDDLGPPDYNHDWVEYFYKRKKPKIDEKITKICPQCYSHIGIADPECPFCQYSFAASLLEATKKRAEYELIPGELVDYEHREISKKDQLISLIKETPKTLNGFKNVAIKMKYKEGAAFHWFRYFCHCRSRNAETIFDFLEIARSCGQQENLAYIFYQCKKEKDDIYQT